MYVTFGFLIRKSTHKFGSGSYTVIIFVLPPEDLCLNFIEGKHGTRYHHGQESVNLSMSNPCPRSGGLFRIADLAQNRRSVLSQVGDRNNGSDLTHDVTVGGRSRVRGYECTRGKGGERVEGSRRQAESNR